MKRSKFIIEGNLENNTTFNGKNAEVSEICIGPKSNNGQILIPQNIILKNYTVTESVSVVNSTNITFENIVVKANKKLPFYIGRECFNITIKNCVFEGKSKSSLIYLESETSHVTIKNNVFNTKTKKPTIILNNSSYNIIQNNQFNFPYFGAVCFNFNNYSNVITDNELVYRLGIFNNLWKRFFPSFLNR